LDEAGVVKPLKVQPAQRMAALFSAQTGQFIFGEPLPGSHSLRETNREKTIACGQMLPLIVVDSRH